MELLFKKTKSLEIYSGNNLNMYPGEMATMSDELAERLLTDFPDNFEITERERKGGGKDHEDHIKAFEKKVAANVIKAKEDQERRKAIEAKDKEFENKAAGK